MKKTFTQLLTFSVCSLLIACASSGGNTPEAVAKNFIEKNYQGDADAVIAMMDEVDWGESGKGKIKSSVESKKAKADKYGGVDKITAGAFVASPNSNDKGTVSVETKFKQGESIKSDVKLIRKENGDWKIVM